MTRDDIVRCRPTWRIAMALLARSCGGGHPRDAELLATFSRHRSDIGRLVAMFQADKGLNRVGRDFTRPDDTGTVGVSAARIQEYRRLCLTVGASNCIEGDDRAFNAVPGASVPGRRPPAARCARRCGE